MKASPPGGVVIFAHTPPPFHGQSLMVSILLDQLKDHNLRVHHVDCRYSEDLTSMGRAQLGKLFHALRYAFRAILLRWRHHARTLYFIPAPGRRPAVLRDLLVLGLLRPFFPKIIFHWHAIGLAHWLDTTAHPLERLLARLVYRRAALSIVLLPEHTNEVARFAPGRIEVVPNGIPDPVPVGTILEPPAENTPVRLLFLSALTRAKGAFTAVEAWRQLNLRHPNRPHYSLALAGESPDSAEADALRQMIAQAEATVPWAPRIALLGPVYDEHKTNAFLQADVFVFPSTSPWESFGLVLVEAGCFGVPCVTFQPLVSLQGLSPRYHRRVPMGDLPALVEAIANLPRPDREAIRTDAREKFSAECFGSRMRALLADFD